MANKGGWTDSKKPNKSGEETSKPWLEKAGEKISSALDAVDDVLAEVSGKNVEQQNKQRIYLNIAQFIQKQSEFNLSLCLSATYLLCKEDDKELLRKNPPNPEAKQLAEMAAKYILTIKVHYDKMDVQNNYLCQTEIYHFKDEKPTAYRAQEQVSWDDLPANVREQVMRTGDKKVSLKLFPQG